MPRFFSARVLHKIAFFWPAAARGVYFLFKCYLPREVPGPSCSCFSTVPQVSFRSSAKRYNDDLWWRDQRGTGFGPRVLVIADGTGGKMFLGIVAMAAIVILTWFMLQSLQSLTV